MWATELCYCDECLQQAVFPHLGLKAHLATACHSASIGSETTTQGHTSTSSRTSPSGCIVMRAAVSPLAVFRSLCRIAVNGVALRPLLSSPAGGERYGVALYAALSLCNHSCRPNATLRQASLGPAMVCVFGVREGGLPRSGKPAILRRCNE